MNEVLSQIRKSLQHLPMAWKPSMWLDTGIPELNTVLGHSTKGLPYGRVIEISGWESMGKSALVLSLSGLAQHDGAHVVYGDVENSFAPDWARTRGLFKCPKCGGSGVVNPNPLKSPNKKDEPTECQSCGGPDSATCGLDSDKLLLIQPYVGRFTYVGKDGKVHQEKEERLSTAQELCVEIEEGMKLARYPKRVVILDSVAALLTEGESLAGIDGANMRTSMELPVFMGRLLRRWVGMAQIYNAMIILVNQLREGPQKFGGPTTPGGNAPKFYSHVRVRVHRVAGGKIMDKGKMIGFCGVMKNLKNKTGGVEQAEVGYKLTRTGPITFCAASEVKKEEGK